MFANVRGHSSLAGVAGVALVVALYLAGIGMMWRAWNTGGEGTLERCELVCPQAVNAAKAVEG